MFFLVVLSLILMFVSILGFGWGIIINARYRNTYVLINASNEDKWRWAKNASFFYIAPFIGGVFSHYLGSGNYVNIDAQVVFFLILLVCVTFFFMIFWSKWDLDRINNRNIKYTHKLNSPKIQEKSKRVKQYEFLKTHFPISEHYARFRAFGFVDNDMIDKDEE